nr:tetratricopeptide repeat protein [candidate division Zixibacteria bacterium]
MLKKILIVFLLVAAGCSQGFYGQGRKNIDEGRYQEGIDYLYKEIAQHPDNYQAWREIGVAFYRQGDLIKAEDALMQANNITPDARTNLFIGLIFEQKKQTDKAIAAYSSALNLDTSAETRNLIRGHLDRLISQKIKTEVETAVANESRLKVSNIPDNSIAVVDFDGSQLPEDLAPISKGLAEFTSIDLAKVTQLKVIDRLKIDVLLNELKLGASGKVDPGTSPRIGRLLGSEHLITGTVLSAGDNALRLDGAIVSTRDSSAERTAPIEGDVNKFFKIQKDFVFGIIDSLGIQLTKAERDAVEEVPTESFLAFMAYCRGLDYQSRGMYDAAREEYNKAVTEDKNFVPAAAKANQVAAVSGGEGGESFETFEEAATSSSESETGGEETGLDQTQITTLLNSGFISEQTLYERFGNPPINPPVINLGSRVIIIRGDLDAE